MWRQQIPALIDAGFRAIAYDRRGHGRSGHNGQGFDIDTFADDLAALMEQLDLKGATLVAHSMAGCEVVRYLSRHGSDRVAKVVLVAPTTPYLIKADDNPLGLESAMFEQTRAMWKADFTQWVADNKEGFFTPETPREAKDWMIRLLLDCPVPVAVATHRAVSDVDFREEMKRMTVPTLVLHGDVDLSAPLDLTGRASADLIPGAELIVFPNAPHGLFMTHTDAVNRAIVDFARA
jgi:pimeloyl-ACP methyl ester carboxylesterase